MIKLEYTPWKPTFADVSDPSPVEELTMTLGDGVSWEEATTEFHNFLRAAGYVIPYEHEEDYCFDCSDPPDMDKSGSLGDRQPEWAMRMSGPDTWWNESNTDVASEDESNTDVAEKTEWVELTGDERSYVRSEYLRGVIGILGVCDFCEAKLKEKNT